MDRSLKTEPRSEAKRSILFDKDTDYKEEIHEFFIGSSSKKEVSFNDHREETSILEQHLRLSAKEMK